MQNCREKEVRCDFTHHHGIEPCENVGVGTTANWPLWVWHSEDRRLATRWLTEAFFGTSTKLLSNE